MDDCKSSYLPNETEIIVLIEKAKAYLSDDRSIGIQVNTLNFRIQIKATSCNSQFHFDDIDDVDSDNDDHDEENIDYEERLRQGQGCSTLSGITGILLIPE